MKQLHVDQKSEQRQAGLIVLDEVIDFTDDAWFHFVRRYYFFKYLYMLSEG